MVLVFAGSREEWAGCLIGWLGKASRKKLIGGGAWVRIPGWREGCSGCRGPSQTGALCPRGGACQGYNRRAFVLKVERNHWRALERRNWHDQLHCGVLCWPQWRKAWRWVKLESGPERRIMVGMGVQVVMWVLAAWFLLKHVIRHIGWMSWKKMCGWRTHSSVTFFRILCCLKLYGVFMFKTL